MVLPVTEASRSMTWVTRSPVAEPMMSSRSCSSWGIWAGRFSILKPSNVKLSRCPKVPSALRKESATEVRPCSETVGVWTPWNTPPSWRSAIVLTPRTPFTPFSR